MRRLLRLQFPALWQSLFLISGTSWLLAPSLNHYLSYRLSFIGQYETSSQPYAWLFRLGDIIAASLLLAVIKHYGHRLPVIDRRLLLIAAIGMFLDPLLLTTCRLSGDVCHQTFNIHSLLHIIDTIVTVAALLSLTLHDVWRRRRIPSVTIVILQLVYGLFFLLRSGTLQQFTTLGQYIYQFGLMLWLAWFVRDQLFVERGTITNRPTRKIRVFIALWAAANGLLAIVSNLALFSFLGRADSLYFGSRTAWLAQHGVLVGVIMLYLSRHILRGEQRARQLLLIVFAIEIGRYSLIAPSMGFLFLYVVNFLLLYTDHHDFQRGQVILTWRRRLQDLLYLIAGLLLASLCALLLLNRDDRASRASARAIHHFNDYVFRLTPHIARHHINSILLAHTFSVFIGTSLLAIMWVLFKPSRVTQYRNDYGRILKSLEHYSQSSEDYFKYWPHDKQYFWDDERNGFIAYRIAGPVIFALADPITQANQRSSLVSSFVSWTREKRLNICFLLVNESSRELYIEQGLTCTQVGASALVDTGQFCEITSRDKWWRWKQNRARKQGYIYKQSSPPHDSSLIRDLRTISDDWLEQDGRQERAFALGYFDEKYLQACVVHYLEDETGQPVAFVNQLPTYNKVNTVTVDLLRFRSSAQDAMPYLLAQVITAANQAGHSQFDLGFVPFAATKSPIVGIASTLLSASRFSARGLEQFKNKFDPSWQANYLAYDGDVADLAIVGLNLEKVMKPAEEDIKASERHRVT